MVMKALGHGSSLNYCKFTHFNDAKIQMVKGRKNISDSISLNYYSLWILWDDRSQLWFISIWQRKWCTYQRHTDQCLWKSLRTPPLWHVSSIVHSFISTLICLWNVWPKLQLIPAPILLVTRMTGSPSKWPPYILYQINFLKQYFK